MRCHVNYKQVLMNFLILYTSLPSDSIATTLTQALPQLAFLHLIFEKPNIVFKVKHLGPGFLDNFTKTLPPDTTSGPCVVAKGPGSGKPCVFPFFWNYDGVRYTGCAWDKARDIAPWCSTKVPENIS